MQPEDVKTLATLCAREEWHKVKTLADRLVADQESAARFFQAIARFHLGEFLAAWFCAERALEDMPENAEVLDLCGRIAASICDHEASKRLHERAIALADAKMRGPLSFNYVGSMMRLARWHDAARVIAEHGANWGDGTRRSIEISLELASEDGITLEALMKLRQEVGTRPPHASAIALALHQAGEWEEADNYLAQCQLLGNEALVAANRLILLIEAEQTSLAYALWRRERDSLRQFPALAGCLQGVVLQAMGSVDAAKAHFAANRVALRRDPRMHSLRDALALKHATALLGLGRRPEARRILVRELQSTVAALPRTLIALQSFSEPWSREDAKRLQVWEVEFHREGDHWVRGVANALTSEAARTLVVETLPEGLQALPFSTCRLVDESCEGGIGVTARQVGYRVSRDLLP